MPTFLKDSNNAPNLYAGGFSGLRKCPVFTNVEKRWLQDRFISVINQLDTQNFCITISLFHASTCFEHMCSSSGGQNCVTPIGVMVPEAV